MTLLTAPVLLARCQALGIGLSAGPSGVLEWEANADPPAELLAALAEHKAEVWQTLRDSAASRLDAPTDRLAAADPGQAEDVGRVIEADLGLPAGSLTLFDPFRRCPGCAYCRQVCEVAKGNH